MDIEGGKKLNQLPTYKIERKDVAYTAFFVEDIPALIEHFKPKHAHVFGHHCTITGGGSLNGIDVGKKETIKIIGRVFDEKGDALLVDNEKPTGKYPHITLSCAEGVKPVYSFKLIESSLRNNKVDYFDQPYEISTTEGYYDGKREVVEKGVYEITDKKSS